MAVDSFKKCPPELKQYGDFFFQNLIYSTSNLNYNKEGNLNSNNVGGKQQNNNNNSISSDSEDAIQSSRRGGDIVNL